ncbi:MAG: Kelch repeat type 1-containing protein, partial [Frankiales bacterium]|nr:Kelch repeat type 1-containing protein [Frankiales bacterium]
AAGVAVVLGGEIHYVGGRSGGLETGEHDVYDPATDRWATAAPMPTPRDHAAAAVVAGVLHVAAGRPGDLAVHEAYDPATGRWATLAPLPTGRSSVAGAELNGRFVVLGGEPAGERSVSAEVDAYDPASRSWARLPDLPGGRQGIGAAVVDGILYLPGGGPTGGGDRQSDTLLVLGGG